MVHEICNLRQDHQLNVNAKVSWTRLLISRVADIQIKEKASGLCVYDICEGCLRKVQAYRES
jgi:hypothetical protein